MEATSAFSIRKYLIYDIWVLITSFLPARALYNLALCSQDMCEFIRGLPLSKPLFLEFEINLKEFSKILKNKGFNESVNDECVDYYRYRNHERELHGKDAYRLIKLYKNLSNAFIPNHIWEQAFAIVLNDFRGKHERLRNEIIIHYINFHVMRDECILGNGTKFSLELRNFEAYRRLELLLYPYFKCLKSRVVEIILDSINPGETLTVPYDLVHNYQRLCGLCTELGVYLCVFKDRRI
ncbi:MAG: hypothetical protein QW303_00065 [Nitrososphaerota archaeon]